MCLTYYVAVQKEEIVKLAIDGFLLGFLAFLTIGFVPDKTWASVRNKTNKKDRMSITHYPKGISGFTHNYTKNNNKRKRYRKWIKRN